MTPRYIVVGRSESGHCCFSASILDTSKPEAFTHANGEPYYYTVAEFFEHDDALRVCDLMNREASS